jgi:hypothetical protein
VCVRFETQPMGGVSNIALLRRESIFPSLPHLPSLPTTRGTSFERIPVLSHTPALFHHREWGVCAQTSKEEYKRGAVPPADTPVVTLYFTLPYQMGSLKPHARVLLPYPTIEFSTHTRATPHDPHHFDTLHAFLNPTNSYHPADVVKLAAFPNG